MKAICVIPARYASTRFPGKALAQVGEKTLIQLVIEQVLKAHHLNEIIVATDDERIEVAVKKLPAAQSPRGVRVEKTRADHPSGTDRIAEVARREAVDIVVNVQGDEPLIDPKLIDELVGLFEKDTSLEMATAKVRISDSGQIQDPNCVKVVTSEAGNALYFSRAVIPCLRDEEVCSPQSTVREPCYYKHLGIYAYRRDFLLKYSKWPVGKLEHAERLEQLRALEHGVHIRVLETQHDSIGVDTPEDLETVQRLLKKT